MENPYKNRKSLQKEKNANYKNEKTEKCPKQRVIFLFSFLYEKN